MWSPWKKADFAIATLVMDTINHRIVESEITTRKDGTYTLSIQYDKPEMILPFLVDVYFEFEHIQMATRQSGDIVDHACMMEILGR